MFEKGSPLSVSLNADTFTCFGPTVEAPVKQMYLLGRSARPVKQICAIHHLKSKMSILAIRTQNTEHCPIHIEAEAFWFPCRSTMLCSKDQQEGATPVSFLTSHNSHQDVVPLASLLHCASVGVFVCVCVIPTPTTTPEIYTPMTAC